MSFTKSFVIEKHNLGDKSQSKSKSYCVIFNVSSEYLRLAYLAIDTILVYHAGQCKRTGGCYNELVVAFLRTGDGLKGKKKSIPVVFMIYL